MTRFTTLLAAILLLPISSAFAVTNIETERLNNQSQGTKGAISLSLDGRIGSSDKIALGTALKLIQSFSKDELIVIMSRDYAEIDNDVNTDEAFVHLRYLTKHNANWGHEVFTQYEENKFSALKQRWLAGGGARYTLTPTNPSQANHLGAGVFYEDEMYASSSTADNEENVRLNFYWSYKNQLTENAQYTSTLYFQPDTNDFADQKGLWQNALSISVTSTISLSLSWEVEHDTQTPDGLNSTETNYTSLLIYNF